MSHVSPAEVRSALRAVLRAVDRHLTHINGNRQWRQEVIARFRATPQQSLPSSTTVTSPSAAASQAAEPGSTTATASSLPISPAGHPPTPAQALALAREWAELANNIARHKELLLSYNIGLDVDERTKRMVEATARRVGFALPSTSASGKK
ncbi:hypothetical protein PLESTB_000489400 [Pleodorina starrii]|uniref:Uncharacterized protein n=1 Tax=Pleodorina starrii TaxID=330485 RepID=A0A9W6BFN9_9CHLO|nr:hypothetical protein PLESTM_000360700 [Pleodorina starrii]GLC51317.1 hypothetical protein PLESTB_000489400 [Pleodorina starrii]GLC63680.1 hypothetical protein PLESTF_000062700 [Pleodorina starrii]